MTLSVKTNKRAAPSQAGENANKNRGDSAQTNTAGSAASKQKNNVGNSARKSVNFLNFDKWGKEMRPHHLMDDDVFNSFSVDAASLQILN